jgi:hypothetical protein
VAACCRRAAGPAFEVVERVLTAHLDSTDRAERGRRHAAHLHQCPVPPHHQLDVARSSLLAGAPGDALGRALAHAGSVQDQGSDRAASSQLALKVSEAVPGGRRVIAGWSAAEYVGALIDTEAHQ